MNSTLDGILIVDQDRKTILQNQRFVDLFNMPPHFAEQGAGDNRLRWVASMIKIPEPFIEKILHLYAHPIEVSRDEMELRDGTILDRYSSPVVGQDGKCYGRIWTFRDITARKQTENALLESNEKFGQLAENISDVFWITSPDMQQVHYVSPAFARIWGHSVESLYANARVWSDAIPLAERERVLASFARLIAGEQSVSEEFRIAHPGGEMRWIHSAGFKSAMPRARSFD